MTTERDIELTEGELIEHRAKIPRLLRAGDAWRLGLVQKRIAYLEKHLAEIRPGKPVGPPCPTCGRRPDPNPNRKGTS